MPTPVAARSNGCDCDRSLTEIAGSIPAGGMDRCLLGRCCVCQVDVSAKDFWRVLPSVECLRVIDELRRGGLGPLGVSSLN